MRSHAFCLMMIAAAAIAVRADVVEVPGRPPAANVTITSLSTEGQLTYRLDTGRDISRPIEEIEYLQVAGWPLFSVAEQQMRRREHRQAISAYNRAMAELQATGPAAAAGLDRALLLRCRLVRAYDLEGRFDRAVEAYLELIKFTPAVHIRMRPRHLPAAGSTFVVEAGRLVDAAAAARGDDEIARSMRQWRMTWPDMAQSRPAAATGPAGAQEAANHELKAAAEVAAIRKLIEQGSASMALTRIATVREGQIGRLVPADLYYWEGRAWLLDAAGQAEPASATAVRRRAGLAFLRLPVHFPEHPLAPEALFRAGELCALDGLSPSAARLWGDLIAGWPDSPWAAQARGRMPAATRPG